MNSPKIRNVISSFLLTGTILTGCSSSAPKENPGPSSPDVTSLKEASNVVAFDRHGTTFMIAENQMVVWFKDTATAEEISKVDSYLSDNHVARVGQIPAVRMREYEITSGSDMNVYLDTVEQMSGVSVAMPNATIAPTKDPNPNPPRDVYSGFWWIDTIRATQAWDITTGSSAVPLAVLDSGLYVNSGYFDSKSISFGGKCVNSDKSYHFSTENECNLQDQNSGLGVQWIYQPAGHGTQVAEIMAASGDDGTGGVGVAWKNPIVSVDLYGGFGCNSNTLKSDSKTPTIATLNDAMLLAMRMGAKVLNVSQEIEVCKTYDASCQCVESVPPSQENYSSLREALLEVMKVAAKQNVLVVLAAGNSGFKNDNQWLPPNHPPSDSNYFVSNMIITGGIDDWEDPVCGQDYYEGLASFDVVCQGIRYATRCSCTSCNDVLIQVPMTVEGDVVEISAPGYRIAIPNVAKNDGSLMIGSGTSFATPMVAGAAGLVVGQHPEYNADTIKNIILQSARPTRGCRQIGHGILDVAAALGNSEQPDGGNPALYCRDNPFGSIYIGGIVPGGIRIYNDTIAFAQGSDFYYANILTGERGMIPKMNGNTLLGLESIWEDKIVLRCTGTDSGTYNEGICLYRIGDSNTTYIGEGAFYSATINGNKIATAIDTNAGGYDLRLYDVQSGSTQDKTFSATYENGTLHIQSPGVGLYNSTVAFQVTRIGDQGGYNAIYNFDTGDFRIIDEARTYTEINPGQPYIYGDRVIFGSVDGNPPTNKLLEYDISSGSITRIAGDFTYPESYLLWGDRYLFTGRLPGQTADQSGTYLMNFNSNAFVKVYSPQTTAEEAYTFTGRNILMLNNILCSLQE